MSEFSKRIFAYEALWDESLTGLNYDFYHLSAYTALEAERIKGVPEAFIYKKDNCLFFIPYIIRNCKDIVNEKWAENICDITSAYGYPCPLFNEEALKDDDFCRKAISSWLEMLKPKKVCSIFLRFHPLINSNTEIWKQIGTLITHGETVVIDLKLSEKELWKNTRKDHKQRINKLKRKNSICIKDENWEYFDDFIELYYQTMDKVNASNEYFFSRQYFYGLKKALDEKIHLVAVSIDNELACMGLFSEINNIIQYHLSCSSLKFQKYAPTKFMLYNVSIFAKENGNKWFHLGGGLGTKRDSLFLFKAGFSDIYNDFHSWRCIIDKKVCQKLLDYKTKSNGSIKNLELKLDGFFPPYR